MRRLRWRRRQNHQFCNSAIPQFVNSQNTFCSKPRPQRRFINRQRFGVMKMPAGLLFRRAAGMKDGGAFVRRETGQFQFLERGGRHGGNLRPMLDNFRRQSARFADFPVGGVVFELKREEFERSELKSRRDSCTAALHLCLSSQGLDELGPPKEWSRAGARQSLKVRLSCGFCLSAGFPPQPAGIITRNGLAASVNTSSGGARLLTSRRFR